jgi:hypothetical protein
MSDASRYKTVPATTSRLSEIISGGRGDEAPPVHVQYVEVAGA